MTSIVVKNFNVVTGCNFKRLQERFSLKPKGIPKIFTGETTIHGTSRIFPISEKFSKKIDPKWVRRVKFLFMAKILHN